MNTSPYFTGAAPNFGPPSGMASLIAQQREPRADLSGFQMFADAVDRFKQQQDLGKAADYFVKASPEALSSLGIHPEEWKTLGARDKSAAVMGLMKQQGTKEAMLRMAEIGQRMQTERTQAQADQEFGLAMQEAAAAAGTRAGASLEPADETGLGPEDAAAAAAGAVPTAGEFMQSLARHPQAWGNRDARALLNYHLLAQQQAAGSKENPLEIDKTSVPGYTIVKPKEGSNFQALPAAADPNAKAVELTDDNGNVVGHAVPGAGGRMSIQWAKPAEIPKLPESFHKTLDDLAQQVQDQQSNLDMTDEELKAKYPGSKPAEKRAASKRALASAKAQAKNTVDRYAATGYLPADVRDQLYAQMGMTPPAATARAVKAAPGGAAAGFKSADEVKQAFQAGQIDKATAVQLLQKQFGLK